MKILPKVLPIKNKIGFFSFLRIENAQRDKFCETIIETSAPKFDFYLLVVLSTLIVSFGILLDNIILVIGGMLVTPLLSPVLAIALGTVIFNFQVFFRSTKIFVYSVFWTVFVAYLVGLFNNFDIHSIQILGEMDHGYTSFIIASIAGVAASYTWVKPDLNSILPGIAITVTLIPPLTAAGLSLTLNNFIYFFNFISIAAINFFGILLSSTLVFSALQFYKSRKKLISEVKEEAKEIKEEGVYN